MSIHMATDGAPFPSVEDDLRRQIMGLRASLASSEAEVARLKALLEPKRPYEPKVGDVATPTPAPGQVWGWADGESGEWVLVRPEPDWESHGRWFIYSITYDCMTRAGYFGIDAPKDSPSVAKKYLRPATPAERAAAGLPAEAHAKPEVLPEHLALLEASAAYWSTYGMGEDKWERMIQAGKDLLAAVARRDGGAK